MMVQRKPSLWQDARAKRVGEFMHFSYLDVGRNLDVLL